MEFRMGRFSEAKATLATLPPDEQAKQEIKDMIATAGKAAENPVPERSNDPVVNAVNDAAASITKGEMVQARNTLENALAKSPDDLRLLQTLVALEFRDGNIEKAKDYLARVKAKDPQNAMSKQWDIALQSTDLIDALKNYQNSVVSDEGARAVVMTSSPLKSELKGRPTN
jgi:predicted Zn-dependent protease